MNNQGQGGGGENWRAGRGGGAAGGRGHHHENKRRRGNSRGGNNGNQQRGRGRGRNDQNQQNVHNGGVDVDYEFPELGADPPPRGNRNGDRGRPGRGNQQQQRGRGRGRENDNNKKGNNSEEYTDGSDNENGNGTRKREFRKPERKHEGPVFGFKRLFNYLNSDPNDVLLSINRDKDDWKAVLESDELQEEKLIVAIEVLAEKVCVDIPILLQQQTNTLTACCSQIFAGKLANALPAICRGNFIPPRRFAKTEFVVDSSADKVMKNIYQFCSFLVKSMPNSAADYFRALIFTAICALPTCGSQMTELVRNFQSLNDQIEDLLTKEQADKEKKERRRRYEFDEEDLAQLDLETPPDSIKNIEIIPSIEELRHNDDPFLRPNKVTGAYNDSDHYIDVQFRLLREDFVRPLRKGIRTFLKDRHQFITGKKKMPIGELRLYTEVYIQKVAKERDTVVYKLKLPEKIYKRIKWGKSKRLLVGSLILFTTAENCFERDNTHFGVVFNRNEKELEKGIVTVSWEGTPPAYDEEQEYVMAESEVYLEAYRHTLDTMKKLELETFPMKKFIVDASSVVHMPQYLKEATKAVKLKLANGEDFYLAPQQQWQWPSAAEFGLDDNQLQAFRAAITNEFSIIQGPPGTGKTFLGLKVAEVFLNNAKLWKNGVGNPITVVCYTNHALDQFLEGILRYYKKEEMSAEIIRIGGRCKSEELEKYTLREVRHRNKRRLPKHYWSAEQQIRGEIYDLENERASGMSEVTGLQDLQGVINFERTSAWTSIQTEYPKVVWSSFQNLKWFGIDDTQLNRAKLTEEDVQGMVRSWFEVRRFPKAKTHQKKPKVKSDDKVERMDIGGTGVADEEIEDEEDYDVDELMAHRLFDDDQIVGEILLQAETSSWNNMGKRLSYLPACSIGSCTKTLQVLNSTIQEATRTMNQAQAFQHRLSKEGEIFALENRKKFLIEIFNLYKEQLLDLPDVTNVLEEVREGGPVVNHFSRLTMSERWALYFTVVDQARHRVAERVAVVEKNLSLAQKQLRDTIQYGDGLILQHCQVVGLTTTGAAKYNNLLRMMESKIVIVEEAAEVFEAHIVTCITKHCEQLILIGDHQQLRPSPTVYELATKFHLDLSLFERMIKNKLHCHQLKIQHRMRPDISDLVKDSIYKELENHDSVKLYPDVKGVIKNVFFITHTEQETGDADSHSKSNIHEAKFIAALCRYLVLQGYNPEQITVLTMYTGQMFLLKKEITNTGTCKGIHTTCVDNFQGEENDIILLSLVRSNSDGKIGFLSIDNRICVALSRAKHGLYVIGNMDQLESKSKTWRTIKDKLRVQEAVGESLELECQVHCTRTLVKSGLDFIKHAPEGGCTVLCDTFLSCSHKCPRVCHVIDKEHEKYKCQEPCLKMCGNNEHPCSGKCFERCPPCLVKVEKTLNCELLHKRLVPCFKPVAGMECYEIVEKKLPCGHLETLACHINVREYTCKVKVTKKLPCGHEKIMECHIDPSNKRCFQGVEKTLPCSHQQNVECWQAPEDVKCSTMVPKKFLKCGHELQVKCSDKEISIPCKGKCNVRPPCGHQCTKLCHLDEDPDHLLYECKKPCAKECSFEHKCKSGHHCYKQCPPCKAKILRTLPCGHEKELECHVDINAYECLETCQRTLIQCGHKCSNLCFQPCGPCQTTVKKRAQCRHTQNSLCTEEPSKDKCMELVPPKTTPACGHKDILVPCKYDGLSAEELAIHCQKPCTHIFNPAAGRGCGHKCGGTCSECLQGRIHAKCKSECGKQLVCGHVCEVPCSSACPPCEKPCMMKCEHSSCKRKCGENCNHCKEKCGWNCEHKTCSKLCGDICDREPCNEPCKKKLKCDHACVGLCGEPCPPLCRVCNKEELTEVFFGTEEEEDARFVYLEDCGHTIEVTALENWINMSASGAISAKCCPKCKTSIRNCRRFGNLIKEHYKDIATVKMRAFGNQANSNIMRDKWIGQLNDDSHPFCRLFSHLHGQIRNALVSEVPNRNGGTRIIRKTVSEYAMRSLDFICENARKATTELFDLHKSGKLLSPNYEKVLNIYRKTFGSMMERNPLSRQEVLDFNEELDRLDYYKQLMIRRSLPNCGLTHPLSHSTYIKAKKIITSTLPFTELRKEEFLKHLRTLDDQLRSGLGVTDRERVEILAAMGLKQGHWYKCPNGHIYAIADCGGATMESTCNECGATIGGGSHRLRPDNQVATEMDGATRSAWPGGN